MIDTEALPHALKLWDAAAREALPLYLKIWLVFLALTFAASLAFLRRHRVARITAAGFVVSHVITYGIAGADLLVVRNGLVSLSHVIGWTPAFVLLIRDWPLAPTRTALFGWSCALALVLGVSLFFDVRDAGMYLYFAASGHPALSTP